MTREVALVGMAEIERDARQLPGPRYLAIVQAFEEAMERGVLRVGQRLPAIREMAARLRVDVGTVSRAYAEMKRRRLVSSEVGRGTFVGDRQPDAPLSLLQAAPDASAFIDLSHNFPAGAPPHPLIGWIEAAQRSAWAGAEALSLQADIGRPAQRETLAQWLASCAVQASADEVLITAGAQHGILLALQATTRPDEAVLCESTTFYGLLSAAHFLGRRLVPLAMDAEGLLPQALDEALRAQQGRVVYCNPTLHNPTTRTMGLARREAIAQVCRRHDAVLIEDDVYGLFGGSGVVPLCALAPERTVYLTGFSKLLAPGLRVGVVRAPAYLMHRLGAGLRATTLMAAAPMVDLVCRLASEGQMPALAQARRAQVQERQAWLRELLPAPALAPPADAFHWWMPIGDWRSEAFAAAARDSGVGVAAGALFAADPAQQPAFARVCIAAAPDRAALQVALTRLQALVRDGPQHFRHIC